MLIHRTRRNRTSPFLRDLVRENHLRVEDFILPVFIMEGSEKQEIPSMPGVYRHGLDQLSGFLDEAMKLGIRAVAPFPAIDEALKNSRGTESTNSDGLYLRAIRTIKEKYPELIVFSDVALDPYSSDGHDGIVSSTGEILNDETLEILGEMAIAQAQAGADFVAPSDMMDGRVEFLRDALDGEGFTGTGILSYCAKYASSFYGPFRDALQSAPKSGDKKTYQMDPANVREALREYELDFQEGADMVMVKPGLPYLDVVRALAEVSDVPVAVYNVSGEYAMLKAAANAGWLDYRSVVLESLLGMKRAGANIILSYHAMEVARWLQD
ncbi:MAG: porphobilinogen synthase [Leptospiraceae bacterium]|nr:porphobilinogen synthase [Leptospiraceae bacterium]